MGDFGVSWRGGGAVGPELARRLAVSVALGGSALLLAAALAMPLSRHACVWPGGAMGLAPTRRLAQILWK